MHILRNVIDFEDRYLASKWSQNVNKIEYNSL